LAENDAQAEWTLPNGWVQALVSEIYDIIGGGTPSTKVEEYWQGDIPWISSADIHGPRDIRPRRGITKSAIENSATSLVPAGSLIVVTRVGLGKVALADTSICFSQDSQALVGSSDFVLPDYAIYYLSQAVQVFKYRSRGTTIAGVTKKQLADLPFALPPLPEQRRIVVEIETQFTRLDAAVAALERAQANLKRYRASVLKAACEGRLVPTENDLAHQEGRTYETAQELLARLPKVGDKRRRRAGRLWGAGVVPDLSEEQKQKIPPGWYWVKVNELGPDPDEVVQVGPMSMKSREFADAGVPVFNVGCVQWDFLDESKLNFLPPDKAERFERYRIKADDLLFTRSGYVGRCAIATDRHDRWLMTFHLLRVRVGPDVCLPKYLRIALEGAPHIKKQIDDATVGTTRKGFNTRLLATLDIPLPPLAEQRRIVAEVERRLSLVGALEASVEAALARAGRLRQAVLKQAFEGRLVPQDPDDEPASVLLERIRAEREARTIAKGKQKVEQMRLPTV
jgi:type I restriction enzyme S subunit